MRCCVSSAVRTSTTCPARASSCRFSSERILSPRPSGKARWDPLPGSLTLGRALRARRVEAGVPSAEVGVEPALHPAERDDGPAERVAHELLLLRRLDERRERAFGVLAVLLL